jgi:hypothetical protein
LIQVCSNFSKRNSRTKKAGDRIKTNRRYAQQLARLFGAGKLAEVWVNALAMPMLLKEPKNLLFVFLRCLFYTFAVVTKGSLRNFEEPVLVAVPFRKHDANDRR